METPINNVCPLHLYEQGAFYYPEDKKPPVSTGGRFAYLLYAMQAAYYCPYNADLGYLGGA